MTFAMGRRTLVTGAGHPHGLEVVRQCLLRGDRVIAAARNPARVSVLGDLRAEFGHLEMLALDPADAASVAEAIPVLQELTSSLDLVVIGPAEPGPHDRPGDAERDASLETMSGTGLVEHYRRHAVAPVLLVRTLLPFLTAESDGRVLVLSNHQGSLFDRTDGGDYANVGSAAGLELLTRALAADLIELGISVTLVEPASSASAISSPLPSPFPR